MKTRRMKMIHMMKDSRKIHLAHEGYWTQNPGNQAAIRLPVLSSFWRKTAESAHLVIWNLLLLSVGSVLCAMAINGILIPHQFLSGGFTGLALIIHYMVPSLPVAALYFLLNVPVYGLGWKYVGRRFFLYSIGGTMIFSAAVAWVEVTFPVHDKLLSAIFAGIITGAGWGLILKSLGSAGGLDILSVIFLKRFSIRIGTMILASNGLILVFAAALFSLEGSLYTLIYLFVSGYIVDLVVTGLSQRKALYIISSHWEEISRQIKEDIQRGVTTISARGGYTGHQLQVLYTVITLGELSRLKQIIRNVDPDAFVVVTDTLEVMGKRIGNQPHW
jgi:uncharacterized membrane-anchored protein YitT (DUF2179 family)